MNIQAKFAQLAALIGQPVEVSDPTALDQCMDFAFKWCQILGIDYTSIAHGYAYQVWKQPLDATVKYFYFIPNTPNGVPKQGDIPVFDANVPGVTSGAGHICVAKGEGDTNNFKSLDQNWNGKQYVSEETHSYAGVLGWLRPIEPAIDGGAVVDKPTLDKLVTESSEYEDFLKAGYTSVSDVTTKLQQLSDQITGLQKEEGAMALATQQDKTQIADLADQLHKQATSDATAIDAGIKAAADLKIEQEKNKQLTADILTVSVQLGNVPYPPVDNLTSRIALLERSAVTTQPVTLQTTSSFFAKFFATLFNK